MQFDWECDPRREKCPDMQYPEFIYPTTVSSVTSTTAMSATHADKATKPPLVVRDPTMRSEIEGAFKSGGTVINFNPVMSNNVEGINANRPSDDRRYLPFPGYYIPAMPLYPPHQETLEKSTNESGEAKSDHARSTVQPKTSVTTTSRTKHSKVTESFESLGSGDQAHSGDDFRKLQLEHQALLGKVSF